MNTSTANSQTKQPTNGRTVCMWKIVLMDSLYGTGTSFDLAQIDWAAFRCLRCDGFSGNCFFYTA